MKRFTAILLTSAALYPGIALAETETATAVDAAADAETAGETEIVVFGRGQSRQTQEIKAAEIAQLTPGSSPIRAIEKLPSVNVQSADPFGAYEWSTRVTIRGFNQNQLGFTLDGIPLGDMTYGNHNGLHISRAVSGDNIGRTVVSQGSGSITAQSTSNLGGTLEFFTVDPADVLGVSASATYGSSETMRGFVRLAAGSEDGARGFVSAQYGKADKWKGEGEQRQWMVSAKGVVPLGAATLDAYASHSDRAEQDYQDLSLGMIARLGYDWDNFGPSNYTLAVRVADIGANRGDSGTTPLNPAAGTVYPAPIASLDDAYYDASGLRRDTLAALGVSVPLGETATIKLKGYYHTNEGQGTWGTPYVNSPTGVPMAVRTTEYNIDRYGVFGSVEGDLAFNHLVLGAWLENNDFEQARRFYAYSSRTVAGLDHLKFMRDPFFTQWDVKFNTKTFQYYVQDDIALGQAKLTLGWKGFKVDNEADPNVSGGRTAGELTTEDWFQPHAGVSYDFGAIEAFAGFTSVTRAFVSSTTSGPFSSTQAGFDAIKPLLKPEQSDTYEAGLRFDFGGFRGVLAGYHVDFRNRLLTIPTSVGIVGAANALQNVGSVRAQGFEASGEYRTGAWSLFGSYSLNDNTYRDDVVIRTTNQAGVPVITTIPTAGKTVVDSPRHILHGEVAYDDGQRFVRVSANHMSKRYFTYTNSMTDPTVSGGDGLGFVPERTLVNLAMGYRFGEDDKHPLEVQFNITNLLDKRHISTIGSNGFGNWGDNQTFLAGAPRQFFVTLKSEY
ncbi:iron complex outermembrane receptor protein [Novosphingobium kunmingense]|uniref:Iron complex outermembrane receptor protein n=1 Tax=Novosphingobium kunmingense TaxID=1211806 RepID=A0A2N0HJE3_9SPHN|nr:TonB-dependent receptor [Novosphingobium kunmingense]PKB19051.1 iron complex outermembrane receptor protein [Novosphingobium kunmingense]